LIGMDENVAELEGIAVSVAGHCRPCLLYHLKRARELGIDWVDIEEAIQLASDIGRSGDEDMHRFASAASRRLGDARRDKGGPGGP